MAREPKSLELIVAPRHWRPEVVDVLESTTDVVRPSPRVQRVRLRRGPAQEKGRAVLLSDDAPVPSGSRDRQVVRLWWNNEDEIDRYASRTSTALEELHVAWFASVVDGVTTPHLDVRHVPYAFAPPTEPRKAPLQRAFFAGEVDVGDACFRELPCSPVTAREDSAAAWAAAEAVVAGTRSQASAVALWDRHVEATGSEVTVWRWAVRNRVRFLLVKRLLDDLGERIMLRGDDWRALGMPASRTRHSRALRRWEYRRSQVCLDLGSKSSDCTLYPRSAELMAMGTGIVQFDTGDDEQSSARLVPEERRAASAAGLVAAVDRALSMSENDLLEENRAIQSSYDRRRQASAARLAELLEERAG